MAVLHFGTSGWSYKEWVGPFYDKKDKMLSYYSKIFKSVEIDSTFYRYPTREQVHGYHKTVSGDFVFAAKLPKLLTHEKLLNTSLGVKEDLFRFLELLEPLQNSGKLGAILIQLPPSFSYGKDHDNLSSFIEMLPQGYDFAVEFRDRSWLRSDIWKLLKRHNVAYTIVDEPLLPPEVHITADFSYIRWHGRGKRLWYNYRYSSEELERWVPIVNEVSERTQTVYGYFNNHYHGYAPENCIQILEMLQLALPEQVRVKEKIARYALQKKVAREGTLEEFGLDTGRYDVRNLILKLTDQGRLERSSTIRDEEMKVVEVTEGRVFARVREYVIEIDRVNGIILHDCDDWKKGLVDMRLCKHLCKLFLSLPREQSSALLTELIDRRRPWKLQYR